MHITDEQITELLENKISKGKQDKILNHISKCDKCLEIVSASIKSRDKINSLEEPVLDAAALKKAEELVSAGNKTNKLNNLFNRMKYFPNLGYAFILLLIGIGLGYLIYNGNYNSSKIHLRNSSPVINLVLESPSDNASINENNLKFNWEKINNTFQYHFILFDEIGNVIFEKSIAHNFINLTGKLNLKPGQKYSWQVKAVLSNSSKIDSKLNVFKFIE